MGYIDIEGIKSPTWQTLNKKIGPISPRVSKTDRGVLKPNQTDFSTCRL